MIIQSFQIRNYKCFKDTDKIQLDPKMNVVVGKNNTGKTALTEVLSLKYYEHLHLSKKTSPFRRTIPAGRSMVEVTFSFSLEELFQLLLGRTWSFRRPPSVNPKDLLHEVKLLFSSNTILFTASFEGNNVKNAFFPELYYPKSGIGTTFKFNSDPQDIVIIEEKRTIKSNSTPWKEFAELLKIETVLLKSERFKQGQSALKGSTSILSDGSNLPDTLLTLATNEVKRYKKVIKLLTILFPEVKELSIPTIGEPRNQVKIHIVDNDALNDRSDLQIPLQDSGTGISQALSIIVAAVNTNFPRTIIIEDPQVFLHPSATRNLINLLKKEIKENQYIITTHSPIVVNAAQPCTILRTSKYRRVGKINVFSSDSQKEVGGILRELGARPSDLFGADRILWVEGPTEQESFPLILDHFPKLRKMANTTAILPINNVGELTGKLKKKVLSIYNKLSVTTGLIPPKIAFVFDREGLTLSEVNDLKKASGGHFWFLGRRMFENYLLNIEPLSLFMEKESGIQASELKNELINWFEQFGSQKKYFINKNKEYKTFKKEWFVDVDGALLLDDLFKKMLQDEYRKTSHGPELTKITLENNIDSLSDLAYLLELSLNNKDSRKINL